MPWMLEQYKCVKKKDDIARVWERLGELKETQEIEVKVKTIKRA